ncbi:2-isopropylmalate synthase [Methylobacter marinus]|uniref:2-isopropylmalate synthase n=1 Tax=Methylobacter marinus TaxID=34058 RepID=UPI00037413BE|nr:2-isopropylmalate synthase [Methylobacter marinus]
MSTAQKAVFDHHKYRPSPVINLPRRQWPDRRIEQAPIWCSEDLRDGNQALINPLTIEQKTAFFQLLARIGFKEIAVGFPSASQTDYDFIRQLIEQRLIPDDVTVAVLMPARETLIRRSFEALKGAKSVIMHLYNSTSRVQREQVFNMDRNGITALAVNGARVMKECAAAQPETAWQFQYSPESFTATEPDYAVEICNAVAEIWQPTAERPIIFNLPSTVEISTPNVYADQIEWFSTHIRHREAVIISVHTHNDRGCAVAAAELALMAGAQRVEGTLFGNGERTGNADIMVMAMNLYSQGVDPELDFSDLDAISRQISRFNQIAVHPRHPYAGDLVFTAFSGSHQDAIKKCLEARRPGQPWNVAYLPIDPADVGRDYQAVIRINSQSGKGGAAYVIERELGLQLPRWLQIEFSRIVQRRTETEGREISAQELVALFEQTYFARDAVYRLAGFHLDHDREETLSARLVSASGEITVTGTGNGALDAFINALERQFGQAIEITDYHEHALSTGSDARAACYMRLKYDGETHTGIACHDDIVSASLNAVLKHIT